MNDKRARNRLAAGRPAPARPLRPLGGRAPADPCRRAAHAAVTARRRMLAQLASSGWPRDRVRRVLALYPARAVDPAWAAARDAYVEHHLLLPLWRRILDRRFGVRRQAKRDGALDPPPSPVFHFSRMEADATEGLPAQAEARATTYCSSKPLSALLRLSASLLLAWAALSPARPAEDLRAASPLCLSDPPGVRQCLAPATLLWGAGLAGFFGGYTLANEHPTPAPTRAEETFRVELAVPNHNPELLKTLIANGDPIPAGMVGDYDLDGKLTIVDYLVGANRPIFSGTYAVHRAAPMVVDTTPAYAWAPRNGEPNLQHITTAFDVINKNSYTLRVWARSLNEEGVVGEPYSFDVQPHAARHVVGLNNATEGVSGQWDARYRGCEFMFTNASTGAAATADEQARVAINGIATFTENGKPTRLMEVPVVDEFVITGDDTHTNDHVVPADNQYVNNPTITNNSNEVMTASLEHLQVGGGHVNGITRTLPAHSQHVATQQEIGTVNKGDYFRLHINDGTKGTLTNLLQDPLSGDFTMVKAQGNHAGGNTDLPAFRGNISTPLGTSQEVFASQNVYAINFFQASVPVSFALSQIGAASNPINIQDYYAGAGEQKVLDDAIKFMFNVDAADGFVGEQEYNYKPRWSINYVQLVEGKLISSTENLLESKVKELPSNAAVFPINETDIVDTRLVFESYSPITPPTFAPETYRVWCVNESGNVYKQIEGSFTTQHDTVSIDDLTNDGEQVKNGYAIVMSQEGDHGFLPIAQQTRQDTGERITIAPQVYTPGAHSAPTFVGYDDMNDGTIDARDQDNNGVVDTAYRIDTGSPYPLEGRMVFAAANGELMTYRVTDAMNPANPLPEGFTVGQNGTFVYQPKQVGNKSIEWTAKTEFGDEKHMTMTFVTLY